MSEFDKKYPKQVSARIKNIPVNVSLKQADFIHIKNAISLVDTEMLQLSKETKLNDQFNNKR
jgi:hypothetical protein